MRRTMIVGVVLAAAVLRGDTVYLRKGGSFEGIITQEGDRQVSLELATGTLSFPRDAVARVERATPDENAQLRAAWKQRYYQHSKFLPPELAGISDEFTRLGNARLEALGASRALAALAEKEARGRADLEQLRAQVVQVSERLQQMKPGPKNTEAYNALVAESNALQAKLALAREEPAANRRERETAAGRIAAYQDALATFATHLEAQRRPAAEGTTGTEAAALLARMAATLAEYQREFTTVSVPAARAREGTIVSVTVNDLAQGRFILDTGASQVTLTDSFARRLRIDVDALPEAEYTLADGHKARGRMVVLPSIRVGDAHAENVEAAILPGRPGEQVDGLLGMSFLRRFSVNLDGSGNLVLRQFAPK